MARESPERRSKMSLMLGLLAAIIVSAIGGILRDDARSFIPKISITIILQAAKRLPASCQARYAEEWLAALSEMEERTAMLYHAVSCYLFAAPKFQKR